MPYSCADGEFTTHCFHLVKFVKYFKIVDIMHELYNDKNGKTTVAAKFC